MVLYEAYISLDGKQWMRACHPQRDVAGVVGADLVIRMEMTRALGPGYGLVAGPPVKKLAGFDNLWESRVRHATGQYRQFFRFTQIAGRDSAVFIDGTAKKGRRLPRHVLESFDRRLNAYVAALEADPLLRDTDRIPS